MGLLGRIGMGMNYKLTPDEAKVIYSALLPIWIPRDGYRTFVSAMTKLRIASQVETPTSPSDNVQCK